MGRMISRIWVPPRTVPQCQARSKEQLTSLFPVVWSLLAELGRVWTAQPSSLSTSPPTAHKSPPRPPPLSLRNSFFPLTRHGRGVKSHRNSRGTTALLTASSLHVQPYAATAPWFRHVPPSPSPCLVIQGSVLHRRPIRTAHLLPKKVSLELPSLSSSPTPCPALSRNWGGLASIWLSRPSKTEKLKSFTLVI